MRSFDRSDLKRHREVFEHQKFRNTVKVSTNIFKIHLARTASSMRKEHILSVVTNWYTHYILAEVQNILKKQLAK